MDPQLIDPENGDYRLAPGSPAEGYGCLTFAGDGYVQREGNKSRHLLRGLREESIDVWGDIDGNTTWDADTVRVLGDLTVLDGVTLSITPGCRVEFVGHHRLSVEGRIQALGSPEERIVFTSADPSGFAPDSTLTGAWDGIHFPGTSALNEPSTFAYCLIEYSKALRDTAMIGAMEVDRFSKLNVINTIYQNNVADWGAALYCIGASAPRLIGCLITNNVAFTGGSAVYSTDAYPRLIACTIAGNHDLNPEPYATTAPVMSMVSKPQTSGSILWDNSSSFLWPIQLFEAKEYYTRYCNVEGGFRGEGCIDLYPFFAFEEGEHPFELLEASPCIDAGPLDVSELNLPALDLAGRPRIMGDRVDMGAYEYQGPTDVSSTGATSIALSSFPNPFNPSTEIHFQLREDEWVTVAIFNSKGERVRTLIERSYLRAQDYRVLWDGRNEQGQSLASGVYLARLHLGDRNSHSKKMLLLK